MRVKPARQQSLDGDVAFQRDQRFATGRIAGEQAVAIDDEAIWPFWPREIRQRLELRVRLAPWFAGRAPFSCELLPGRCRRLVARQPLGLGR